MRSCAWRTTEREQTLADLATVGITPEVFLSACDPATREKGIETALEALSTCASDSALVLEDDITPDSTFPLWLAVAEKAGVPVTFCTMRWHIHTPEVKQAHSRNHPFPTGLYPVADNERWWGSQAIYLPEKIVTLALEAWSSPDRGMGKGGFDNWLRRLFNRHGVTLHVAVPNPVQHRDPPPTFGHEVTHPRVSCTFGKQGTFPLHALAEG